jgi:ribosome biogenesis GTPase / thiamine phosphate phosphatase
MQSLIVLNKVDLAAQTEAARARLEPFTLAGYRILETSATRDAAPLLPLLRGQLSVLLGQSGMGKSTLINALVPEAKAATNEISRFLASGRHTTTASRLYRLDAQSALIDSPGIQEFGLAHLKRDEIEAAIPEFRAFLGYCRFPDCRHQSEPGCALRKALNEGSIHPRRFELFQRILRGEARGVSH